jgi:hypothetical protein
MNLRQQVVFAFAGWLAGVGMLLAVAFVIFPAVLGGTRFSGSAAELLILGIVGVVASVAALLGGVIGGRVVSEGGYRGQIIMAALVGALLALPVSCVAFWYTGW